jgi:hypothetical protein
MKENSGVLGRDLPRGRSSYFMSASSMAGTRNSGECSVVGGEFKLCPGHHFGSLKRMHSERKPIRGSTTDEE